MKHALDSVIRWGKVVYAMLIMWVLSLNHTLSRWVTEDGIGRFNILMALRYSPKFKEVGVIVGKKKFVYEGEQWTVLLSTSETRALPGNIIVCPVSEVDHKVLTIPIMFDYLNGLDRRGDAGEEERVMKLLPYTNLPILRNKDVTHRMHTEFVPHLPSDDADPYVGPYILARLGKRHEFTPEGADFLTRFINWSHPAGNEVTWYNLRHWPPAHVEKRLRYVKESNEFPPPGIVAAWVQRYSGNPAADRELVNWLLDYIDTELVPHCLVRDVRAQCGTQVFEEFVRWLSGTHWGQGQVFTDTFLQVAGSMLSTEATFADARELTKASLA